MTDQTIVDRLRKRAREEPSNGQGGGKLLLEAAAALERAHAARDAAEERANLNERVGVYATLEIRKAAQRELDLRAQLTTALRERDDARAALERYEQQHAKSRRP